MTIPGGGLGVSARERGAREREAAIRAAAAETRITTLIRTASELLTTLTVCASDDFADRDARVADWAAAISGGSRVSGCDAVFHAVGDVVMQAAGEPGSRAFSIVRADAIAGFSNDVIHEAAAGAYPGVTVTGGGAGLCCCRAAIVPHMRATVTIAGTNRTVTYELARYSCRSGTYAGKASPSGLQDQGGGP